MDIFIENQYIRTKEFHKEILLHSLFKRPRMLVAYIALAVIFIVCIFSLPFPGILLYSSTAGIAIPFSIFIVVLLVIRYFRTVDICYKRDLEINNGEPVEVKMILTSDGIETCRVNSESKNHFSYNSVKKIITTRNYYALLTEAKYYIVFRKDGFITGTADDFLSFINNKIKHI